jgi:hypothetical protein
MKPGLEAERLRRVCGDERADQVAASALRQPAVPHSADTGGQFPVLTFVGKSVIGSPATAAAECAAECYRRGVQG